MTVKFVKVYDLDIHKMGMVWKEYVYQFVNELSYCFYISEI